MLKNTQNTLANAFLLIELNKAEILDNLNFLHFLFQLLAKTKFQIFVCWITKITKTVIKMKDKQNKKNIKVHTIAKTKIKNESI